METAGATALSRTQVERFRTDGYLVLESLFRHDELEAMRSEADRILRLIVHSSIAHGENNPRTSMTVAPDGWLTMRKVQPVNDLSPVIEAISTDERLLAPMRQLLDDEPVIMEEKLNYKQRVHIGTDAAAVLTSSVGDDGFGLHHDWGYYRQQGYPESTLSSAVALDDCAGRGPIKVIPGSHLVDAPMLLPDPAQGQGLVADGFFGPERVSIDAPAGSVMVFHSKLVHDSEPNRSGLPRRMMIYSHYPASHGGEPDRRNGPQRRKAQAFEQEYRDLVATGRFTDTAQI